MAWIANRDERWVERYTPEPNTVCVSITDPYRRVAKLPDGFEDVLRLRFYDLEHAEVSYMNGGREILCDREDAAKIAEFARKHRGKNFLVHCAAGISRSGAVVEALLETFPEYEDRGGHGHGWPRWPNGLVKTLVLRALSRGQPHQSLESRAPTAEA